MTADLFLCLLDCLLDRLKIGLIATPGWAESEFRSASPLGR